MAARKKTSHATESRALHAPRVPNSPEAMLRNALG